jgi:hypothetical protein
MKAGFESSFFISSSLLMCYLGFIKPVFFMHMLKNFLSFGIGLACVYVYLRTF